MLDARYASRAVMWAESKFGESRGIELAQAIFKAYYVEGKNIGDTQTLVAIAQSLGMDAEEVSTGISSANTREQLRAEIDLATAKGVFGSPFFLLDGEPFWGFDRMGQLEAALQPCAPLTDMNFFAAFERRTHIQPQNWCTARRLNY